MLETKTGKSESAGSTNVTATKYNTHFATSVAKVRQQYSLPDQC